MHSTWEGSREAVAMIDIVVGVIGVALILYLFATVLWPEKF
jgi:K+-transporting ATPase KdpF subunit